MIYHMILRIYISILYLAGSMELEEKVNDLPQNKNIQNSNMPWVEKYRPTQLGDLISHESILSTCIFLVIK